MYEFFKNARTTLSVIHVQGKLSSYFVPSKLLPHNSVDILIILLLNIWQQEAKKQPSRQNLECIKRLGHR